MKKSKYLIAVDVADGKDYTSKSLIRINADNTIHVISTEVK